MSKRQIIVGMIFTLMLALGAGAARAATKTVTIRVTGMT